MHEKAEWISARHLISPTPSVSCALPLPKMNDTCPSLFCGKREVGEGGLGENGIGWRRAHSALLHSDSSGRLGGEGGACNQG